MVGSIAMLFYPDEVVGATEMYLGSPFWSEDLGEMHRVLDLLLAQKVAVAAYFSGIIESRRASVVVAAHFWWDGEFVRAIGNGATVDFAMPRDGQVGWLDSMVIPVDAPNRENAMRFSEFMSTPENATTQMNYYSPSSPLTVVAAPGTTAIAIRRDRILARGDNTAIRAHIGPETRIIDSDGRDLKPGFIESHLHLFIGGVSLSMLVLGDTFGFDAVYAAFDACGQANPGDGIPFAKATYYTIIGNDRRPGWHLLDRILPDSPICLPAVDLHCAWANTRALDLAGILHGADPGPGRGW